MKTKSIFLSCVLTIISLTDIFAQSGRDAPKQTPTPQSVGQPAQNSARADEYKLVFSPHILWVRASAGEAAYRQSVVANLDETVEQMNRAGAQGYRLVAAVRQKMVSLMRLDEGQYEYRHFVILNNFTRWRVDFNAQHEKLTRQGFRFVSFYSQDRTCEIFNPQVTAAEECEFTNVFFYEREKGVRQPNKQLLVTTNDSADKPMDAELTELVNEKLSANIYPVGILSRSEMLLEQVADKDELVSDKPEVQVIEGTGAGDAVLKRINALAQHGFRVWLAKNNLVVMYRRAAAAAPLRYEWLEAKKKNFGKELVKLALQGAQHRAFYTSDKDAWKGWLLFEVPQVADSKRREYKVLQFDFDYTIKDAEGKTYVEFSAKDKETLGAMNKLVKEGYEARELFHSDCGECITSVLLERESN